MKYFIYCRKSSDREDRQILSPEAQKRILLEYAERHRLQVLQVYVEQQTAYKTGRPLFNEMLQRLERGQAQAILVYHLTRLARNSFDGGRLIYMMDEESVEQIITPEKVYTNNADDKFMMQIHFAMAKKSSDDTSQFVRRDVESKLLRGELPGRVPPGYLNITQDGHIAKSMDDTDKYLKLLSLGRPLNRAEIDPVDGPIVRKLFEEAAGGIRAFSRLREIAFDMGLRSRNGKPLNKTTIANLLGNPFYYGAIVYNGVLYDNITLLERTSKPSARIQHEPLVTKELFDQVQKRLFGRRRGAYRRHLFPFAGCTIHCGDCGCPVTGERHKGHVYYHCTNARGVCSQTDWTRAERLEEQVIDLLAGLRIPPSFLEYAYKQLQKSHTQDARMADSLRRKVQSELNALHHKKDRLLDMKLSPANHAGELLSDAQYMEKRRELEQQIGGLEQQLASQSQNDTNRTYDYENFFRFTQDLALKFRTATSEQKREVIVLVWSTLTLKDHVLAPVYREPYKSLMEFPLAGAADNTPFVPQEMAEGGGKPEILEKWLHLLITIRTHGQGVIIPRSWLRDELNANA